MLACIHFTSLGSMIINIMENQNKTLLMHFSVAQKHLFYEPITSKNKRVWDVKNRAFFVNKLLQPPDQMVSLVGMYL